MLGGAGLLLLVLLGFGLIFYRNRTLASRQAQLLLEQRLFRAQMNPHFLYNALTSIHGFIFEGDRKQAAEYLSTFSALTREILSNTSTDITSLQKELQTLKKYMEIQQLRFPTVNLRDQVRSIFGY